MLALARNSLLSAFGLCEKPLPPDWLDAPRACFVTLTNTGVLRGCIGTLEPRRSLGRDLIENACNAAFSDPRFPPVTEAELPSMDIEISVLTSARLIDIASEAELLAELRPGVDGVIVEDHGRRATFLPTVWEQLPKVEDFVAALKRKAGLPANGDSGTMHWFRYETQHAESSVL